MKENVKSKDLTPLKVPLKVRGLLVSLWREFGLKMTDLQPILNRDLSTLSKSSKVAKSIDGQKAIKN